MVAHPKLAALQKFLCQHRDIVPQGDARIMTDNEVALVAVEYITQNHSWVKLLWKRHTLPQPIQMVVSFSDASFGGSLNYVYLIYLGIDNKYYSTCCTSNTQSLAADTFVDIEDAIGCWTSPVDQKRLGFDTKFRRYDLLRYQLKRVFPINRTWDSRKRYP